MIIYARLAVLVELCSRVSITLGSVDCGFALPFSLLEFGGLVGLPAPVNNRPLGLVVSGGSRLPNKSTELWAWAQDADLRLQVEVWTRRRWSSKRTWKTSEFLGLLGSQQAENQGMDVSPICPG